MRPIVPNLWCDADIEEKVAFYVALLDDARVLHVQHYGPGMPGPEGAVMLVEFELLGQTYVAINGGPQFPYSEALSFEVRCETQDEIDRIWSALADGGTPGPCGWIKDRWGLSWQVTPAGLTDLARSGDDAAMQRAMGYVLSLDGEPFSIARLEAAIAG